MIYRNKSLPRKGMILLVVVAFLALFSVMGVTYIIYADSQLRQTTDDVNGQDVRQNPVKIIDLDPSFILNFFLERFLYDQADVTLNAAGAITDPRPDSVYSALRGHSLARNIYGWNDTANALNDKPFSGTGKLNRQISVEGQNIEEWKIVNHTAFNPATLPIIDPERGLRTAANTARSNFTSAWNAPYTYPDQNNFYLGWLKSDGSMVKPSFHRDYIFGSMAPPFAANPNWTNAIGKYLTPRPRPSDHNGFPYPEADGMDVKNLEGYPGGNDSIWIDVGSPVFKSTDGRKYKIMIAPLILELDGKLNLNVAGNIMGAGGSHGSNQGWGAWEVNPSKVAQAAEVQAMIGSFPNAGSTSNIQLPGRYANNFRTPSGANGALVNYPNSASYAMADFNGAVDSGAGGVQGPLKVPAFNDANVAAFQSFPFFPTQNWGGAGVNEVTDGTYYNHASLYNPVRPMNGNRVFSARDTAGLLNWGSKSSTFSSSSLMQFFPNTMEYQNPNTTNLQTIKNRSFVTTLSSDLARITTPPYIASSSIAPYQMNPNYPRGNNIAYAPYGTGVPVGSTSDTETTVDGMGNTITSSLRSINSQNMKVDLSRPLSAYPAVNTAFTGVPGGGGGRYVMNATPAAAIIDRQKFAVDIFNALLKATGAKDMSQQIQPRIANGDYEINRYLAQLAANMVDYIDSDDVMTTFIWKYDPLQFSKNAGGITYYPCKYEPTFWEDSNGNILKKIDGSIDLRNSSLDERVYGVELNKVVLNEVYSEIINDPTDTFPEKPPTSMKFPASKDKPFQVHFWVELMNPLPAPTVPSSLVNHAILEQDPIAAAGDSSVYQLEIRDQSASNDIFLPDNPLGQTRVGSKSVITNFQSAGMGQGVNLLAPAVNNYLGTEGISTIPNTVITYANGFIVLGSNTPFPNSGPVYDAVDPTKNETPKPYTSINNIANIKKDELKYTIPIEQPAGTPDPAYNKANFTTTLQNNNKPSIVLRRLANPNMFPQPDPTQPNYNPYVTVDVMDDIKINDGVTNATDDKKAAPPTIENRSSVVRQQPYQELNKKNVGGIFDVSTNMAKSLVKQPQHTFLRQNGTKSEMPGGGINAADGLLNLPFTWMVHLDRVPISMPELMHVAGVAPKGVTTAFNNPAFTDGANPIGHKAPWLDGGSRLARFLEFSQVKNRQAGVAQDGRQPGLVNINAIWDQEVFSALCDANNNNNFTQAEVDAIFNAVVGTRSPSSAPTFGDNPFWSLGVGQSGGADDWSANPRGLNNTIFRIGANGTLFDLPAVNTAGQNRDAYQKKELLTKIFNSITTKSNTFGVWLTAGYFEVTDDSVKPVKLGAEIGKADGTNIRHRMFAIVDRSNMVAGVGVSNVNVPGPGYASGFAGNLAHPNGKNTSIQNGMVLTFDPNTDNEETVQIVSGPGGLGATFTKSHAIKCTIINRGNPGPWVGYDRTKDREVVPYAEIIE